VNQASTPASSRNTHRISGFTKSNPVCGRFPVEEFGCGTGCCEVPFDGDEILVFPEPPGGEALFGSSLVTVGGTEDVDVAVVDEDVDEAVEIEGVVTGGATVVTVWVAVTTVVVPWVVG
jgi:hypothetical protein